MSSSGSLDPQHQNIIQVTILVCDVCEVTHTEFQSLKEQPPAQYSTTFVHILSTTIMANKCLPS
jgi:hypothetical protein